MKRALTFILSLAIVFFLAAASVNAIDHYFNSRVNFPPTESRIHNHTIISSGNITITLPAGFTFNSSNATYAQSGSNYTWTLSSLTTFNYALKSPENCAEDTIYKSQIYENGNHIDEFTYVCIPDIKVVDYKVEYGHGCGNYLDQLYISNESATLFNLLRVWNIGHYLSPNENAQNAMITCNYPDFTVRTYGRAEVGYPTGSVNATFLWTYIEGGYWFRIGVISQDVVGTSIGYNYSVNCTELTYQFNHSQVIAPFRNYTVEVRSAEPFVVSFENISGSSTTSKVTIRNIEKYSAFDIFFDRVLNGYQSTERLLRLDSGESVSYEIDKNSTYNFTVHFIPPWQKNCWSKYYYDQAFEYSEGISDAQDPSVTLVFPSSGTIYTSTDDVTLRVTATDDVGLANCTIYTDISGSWALNTTKNYTGTSDTDQWAFYNLPNGTYTWNALCYDSSGRYAWAPSNYTFTINLTSTDTTPPVVKLIAPEDNTNITAIDDVALYASAEDDIELDYCTLYTNMSGSWAANGTKNFSGKYDADVWNLYNLSNGTYLWNVLCYDAAGNYAWNSTNQTFTISYSPGEVQYITTTIRESSHHTRYVYVNVSTEKIVEVPGQPEDRIFLKIIKYPKNVSVTDQCFDAEAIVANVGMKILHNITVQPEISGGWTARPLNIGRIDPGNAAYINLTICPPLICEIDDSDKLPMIGTVKPNISVEDSFYLKLTASGDGLVASEQVAISSYIPFFGVTTDSYEYNEGEIMTICIIVNNLKQAERDKVEFELELYDETKTYLADYLSAYTVKDDSIFLLKKSYLLNYIPVTKVYPLNASMYEDGALFTDIYTTGKAATKVKLYEGPDIEFPLPIPLWIQDWVARLALLFLLVVYINIRHAAAGAGAAAGGSAAVIAPKPVVPITIGRLCRKKVCERKNPCKNMKLKKCLQCKNEKEEVRKNVRVRN